MHAAALVVERQRIARSQARGPHLHRIGVAQHEHLLRTGRDQRDVARRERIAERDRLMQHVLRVRDKDGTWNDRVFPRTKNYGTAMVALILLNDGAPLPPALATRAN